jgi:hypothetical protein
LREEKEQAIYEAEVWLEANTIAWEFHCEATGHCYVDYVRREDIEVEGDIYAASPLFRRPARDRIRT